MKRNIIFIIAVCILCAALLTACSGGKTETVADKTEAAAQNTETVAAEKATATEAASELPTALSGLGTDNTELYGTWVYVTDDNFGYTFNEDGTGVLNNGGNTVNYTYYDNDGHIEMLYEGYEQVFTTAKYAINDGVLSFEGLEQTYIKK